MDMLGDFWQLFFPCILVLAGACGVLAMASPRAFGVVAGYSSRLVHGSKGKTGVVRWVDIDKFVLQHARYFGFLVTASVGYLAYLMITRDSGSSDSFLIVVVGVSFAMGILSLVQMAKQKHLIASHMEEAYTDVLTNLANRRAFDVELARSITNRQRRGTPLSLLLVDVDFFKQFNDTHGHPLGDAILKEVAQRLTRTTPTGGTVARLGGDEFAVILPNVELDQATSIAESARVAVGDRPMHVAGTEHHVTLSIGLAEAHVDDEPATLIRQSDAALYTAKEAGRNCCYRQNNPEPAVAGPCR
ncbi:MAG: GGDEF domain-containing protein [Pirellulales bacterium]|nr:GGDEF domain-containing protein [Pirellulales bacterium]